MKAGRTSLARMRTQIKRDKPELSSQQHPDRTVRDCRSSARDEGAGRERLRGNLKKRKKIHHQILSCCEMWIQLLCPAHTPMAWDVSTTGTRDTGVSWQRSCSVRSVVDVEVKPLSSSCWRPVKLLHLSWFCSFSSFSLFSALSSVM